MKVSSRHDVEVPIEFAFERITDFGELETQAMRRGIDVHRKNPKLSDNVGAVWDLKVPFRGKPRDITSTILECDAPNMLVVQSVSGGLEIRAEIELIDLSKTRTRMFLSFDVTPNSLSARVLLQSVKFAKGAMQKRLKKRLAQMGDYLEFEYAQSTKS